MSKKNQSKKGWMGKSGVSLEELNKAREKLHSAESRTKAKPAPAGSLKREDLKKLAILGGMQQGKKALSGQPSELSSI